MPSLQTKFTPTSTTHEPKPRPQVQTPKLFDGDDSTYTYRDYITACESYCVSVYGDNFSATSLLQTARSFLTDAALTFSLHDMKRNPARDWNTWDGVMKARWLDPNLRTNSVTKMMRMRQETDEIAHDFCTRFDMCAGDAEISLAPMHISTVSIFLTALQSDLRNATLTKFDQDTVDKMTWAALCKATADSAHALGKYVRKTNKRTRGNNQGDRDSNDRATGGRQRLGNNPKGQPRRARGRQAKGSGNRSGGKGKSGKNNSSGGKSNNRQSSLNPATTQEQRTQYMREGRCFDCGNTGHRSGDASCPAHGSNREQGGDVAAISSRITQSVFDRLSHMVTPPPNLQDSMGNDQAGSQLAASVAQTGATVNPNQTALQPGSLVLRPQQRGRRGN